MELVLGFAECCPVIDVVLCLDMIRLCLIVWVCSPVGCLCLGKLDEAH